ncbi:hypothetical protein DMUE_3984, partial [Dictyocoela muelleri]
YLVTDYNFAINETIKRLAIHDKYSKREIERIEEDAFMNGIDRRILFKFMSEDLTSPNLILSRIAETEKYILSNIKNSENVNVHNLYRNTNEVKEKWCKFHKVKTHDNDECLAQKRNKYPKK